MANQLRICFTSFRADINEQRQNSAFLSSQVFFLTTAQFKNLAGCYPEEAWLQTSHPSRWTGSPHPDEPCACMGPKLRGHPELGLPLHINRHTLETLFNLRNMQIYAKKQRHGRPLRSCFKLCNMQMYAKKQAHAGALQSSFNL